MAVRDAQRRGYLNQTEIKYIALSTVSSLWSYFLSQTRLLLDKYVKVITQYVELCHINFHSSTNLQLY